MKYKNANKNTKLSFYNVIFTFKSKNMIEIKNNQ